MARIRLSMTSCRTSRRRDAPSASRRATSRPRREARTRRRFAALTPAITRTRKGMSAMPAASSQLSCLERPETSTLNCSSGSSEDRTIPAATTPSSLSTLPTPTPSRNRPTYRILRAGFGSFTSTELKPPGPLEPLGSFIASRSVKTIGSQRSTFRVVPANPCGATPMMMKVCAPARIGCPITEGAPPNSRIHRARLITATDADSIRPSSGANVRPISGRTPSTSK